MSLKTGNPSGRSCRQQPGMCVLRGGAGGSLGGGGCPGCGGRRVPGSHSCPRPCFQCKGKQWPAQPRRTLGLCTPYCYPLPCSSQLTAACALRSSIVSPTFCDLIWGMMNVFFCWVGLFWFGLFSGTGHFPRGSNLAASLTAFFVSSLVFFHSSFSPSYG